MRKFLCLFITIIITITIINISAFAKDCKFVGEDSITLTITGQKPEETVSIMVLYPGMQLDDSTSAEDASNIFAAYTEETADENGELCIHFNTHGKSGKYPVYIGSVDKSEPEYVTLYYVRESENQAARLLIDQNENISDIISENKYALDLNEGLVNSDATIKAGNIYKQSVTSTSSMSIDEAAKKLNKALAIANYENENITLFSEYYDDFDIADDVKTWINKNYITDDAKRYIEQKLSKKYSSFVFFDSDILQAVVLATVKYSDGSAYVKEILTQYASELGIKSNRITDSSVKYVVDRSFSSMPELISAINSYTNTNNNSNSSGGSSGSGRNQGGISSVGAPMVNTAPQPYIEEKIPFSDLNGYSWAEEAINYLYDNSIVSGKSSGAFKPGDNVLREEFVKIVMKSLSFENLYGEISFNDVSVNDWYYTDVKNAYLCGIVKGIDDTNFGSGNMIIRQDMAKILYDALLKKGVQISESHYNSFNDSQSISDYALNAVNALKDCGIINGDDNNCFNPHSYATRAEAAKMIFGTLTYMGGN